MYIKTILIFPLPRRFPFVNRVHDHVSIEHWLPRQQQRQIVIVTVSCLPRGYPKFERKKRCPPTPEAPV